MIMVTKEVVVSQDHDLTSGADVAPSSAVPTENPSTLADIYKSQADCAIECTEKLLGKLKQASDFGDTKNAIMEFISGLDCSFDEEESPFILGDTDFAHLFVQSLERRGKVPLREWVPGILTCAQAEYSPEVMELVENLRKSLSN
jgi:hypothetical protein